MLKINGKTFMNLQEAVQWLLDNNALPFQCSANYIANTEIGMGTIVNPSPAKVRIGSLIFFADSKVSTVIGLTENGFIVSDQYNDLVDDVVYVSNVSLNASGHLIVTLSNGTNIDAGLIKQITNFSINASQHLVANYNDGTNTDLGEIFNGNINISGNLNVGGDIIANGQVVSGTKLDAPLVTGDEIVEKMSGYSATMGTTAGATLEKIYVSAVKNGNKLTFVVCCYITNTALSVEYVKLTSFAIPSAVGTKLNSSQVGLSQLLDIREINAWEDETTKVSVNGMIIKQSNSQIDFGLDRCYSNLVTNKKYFVRYEATFLLSPDLA